MSKNNIIQAIGVSNGIGYAKAYCIKQLVIDFNSNTNLISKEEALEKLENAIAKTQEQLQKIKELSREKLGEEKAMIFEAHMNMANDPEILNQINPQ